MPLYFDTIHISLVQKSAFLDNRHYLKVYPSNVNTLLKPVLFPEYPKTQHRKTDGDDSNNK